MLAGSDVKIVTGSGAVTIQIVSPLTWGSPTRLTLDANLNVVFKAKVTVAGTGAMTIVTDDGGAGGDLLFFSGGSVSFWDENSSLIINGTSFTLVDDLQQLARKLQKDPGGTFALAEPYDATHRPTKGIPVKTELTGEFEGLGNRIVNLVINPGRPRHDPHTCVGMFGSAAESSVIRDVRLSVDVYDWYGFSSPGMGGLVGCSSGQIVNASVRGSLYCHSHCHFAHDIGLVAGDAATILRSSARGKIDVENFGRVGGLAGYASTIVASQSDVAISTFDNRTTVGGLAGEANVIMQSHATGSIGNQGNNIRSIVDGGLVGSLVGDGAEIHESYAAVDITSGNPVGWIGGLVGQGSNISNSYATGKLTYSHVVAVGGLVAKGSNIQASYAMGKVCPQTQCTQLSANDFGGVIGDDDQQPGSMSDDYWDLDTSGVADPSQGAGNIPNDPGLTGLTDKQLRRGLPAGFDPSTWGRRKKINNGYPYLLANPPPE
jgi:hypothetical protein